MGDSDDESKATATEKENDENEATAMEKENDSVRLSDSVIMHRHNPICSAAHVYHGLFENGDFGEQKIAVKFSQRNKLNIREAKILHELGSHPNVVTFYEADNYSGGPYPAMYIAMELCQTLNLHDRIVKNKKDNVPFDPERSLLHAKEIASGVDFIHKKGIINRDLKPQNILISLDGENLKVADFGLSKPLRRGRSMTRQSFRGAGTDGYRAPETYNQDVITQFSDIYSLALVFYFIWSYGCHPFGDDVDDWNSNIKKNRGRNLRQIRIQNKRSAERLLDWMLQMDPKKRPTSQKILEHSLFTGAPEEEDLPGPSTSAPHRPQPFLEPIVEQQATMGDEESLEAILEEENCQMLIKEGKYANALIKLKDLVKSGHSELTTQLKIAECGLQLGMEESANRAIAVIKQKIEASQQQRTIMHEIKALVNESVNSFRYIQSAILVPSLSLLYSHNLASEAAIVNILECFVKMYQTIKGLVKGGGRSTMVAFNIGYPAMYDMVEHFRQLDCNPEATIVPQALCLTLVGGAYTEINDYNKAIECYREGIRITEDHYGSKAPNFWVYGSMHGTMATAEYHLGNYAKAKSLYEQSLEFEKQATDFDDQEGRMRSFEGLMTNLNKTQDKLMQGLFHS